MMKKKIFFNHKNRTGQWLDKVEPPKHIPNLLCTLIVIGAFKLKFLLKKNREINMGVYFDF